MRVQLDRQIGLDVLQRVSFKVSTNVEDAKISHVSYDADALHAPVARIGIEAGEAVSTDGLVLQVTLSIERRDGGEKLAVWTSELNHDDLEEGPYDVAGSMASKSMECKGMFTARAWYTRALPRKWMGIDVAVSSLAVWQLL